MITEVYGHTDIGRRRELNEDSFKICGFENGSDTGFCILADGMGGHNAGEVASGCTVDIIAAELLKTAGETDIDAATAEMADAIDLANAEIYEMSLRNPAQAGMGSTAVIVYSCGSRIRIANIGDSRAYLINSREICRMTIDHSVVEQLIRSGSITREDAKVHPDKNIITRAVGTEDYVEVDFFDYDAEAEDVILLCSDGLTEMVSEEEIQTAVNTTESVEAAVKSLIDRANENGGTDNITVIAIRFKEEGTEI